MYSFYDSFSSLFIRACSPCCCHSHVGVVWELVLFFPILCPAWTWSRATFVYSRVCQVSSTDISEGSQVQHTQNWPQCLSSLLLGHYINLYSCSIPSLWKIPKSPTAALTALLNSGPGFQLEAILLPSRVVYCHFKQDIVTRFILSPNHPSSGLLFYLMEPTF